MKMRPGGMTRISDTPDRIAGFHSRTDLDAIAKRQKMPIRGRVTAAVINFDEKTISAVPSGKLYHAVCNSDHRRTRDRDISDGFVRPNLARHGSAPRTTEG